MCLRILAGFPIIGRRHFIQNCACQVVGGFGPGLLRDFAAIGLVALLSGALFSVSLAASEATHKIERWGKVLEIIGDKNDDGAIDEDEIEAFLKGSLESRLKAVIGAAFEDVGVNDFITLDRTKYEEFVELEAIRVFNAADRFSNGKIELNEMDKLESVQLKAPFSKSFGELFLEDLDKISPAQADGPSFLDKLTEKVSVRRSFLDAQGVGRPATLTWSRRGGNDKTVSANQDRTAFEFRGAVSIKPVTWITKGEQGAGGGRKTLHLWSPVLVLEADLSSDESKNRDKIIHRFGMTGGFFSSDFGRGLSGHNFDATFDLTTNRDYDVKSVGGTIQYSPNFRRIGIGEYVPAESQLAFRWRPYLGLTFAQVGEKFEDATLQDFADFFVKLGSELRLGARLRLTPEFTFSRELKNAQEEHLFFESTLRFLLDERGRFSLDFSYTRGEESPDYLKREATRLGLGIKL